MAAINDLLRQNTDVTLQKRLTQEFNHLSKNKKFGLVFEEHVPEYTTLYGVAIKRGSTVARKTSRINDVFTVVKANDEIALFKDKTTGGSIGNTHSRTCCCSSFWGTDFSNASAY